MLWGVRLPLKDASQRRLCYRLPWRIWWLPWGHELSPRGLVLLWFSWMIALFKSFQSRQILNLPFAFLGYVRLLTHGVGSVCLVMIPCHIISASSFLISSLYSMGTFHLCVGLEGQLGLSWCHTCPACLRCSQSCWGTTLEDPWYCQWILILAPCRWGWILILEVVDCWMAVLSLVVPSFWPGDLKWLDLPHQWGPCNKG